MKKIIYPFLLLLAACSDEGSSGSVRVELFSFTQDSTFIAKAFNDTQSPANDLECDMVMNTSTGGYVSPSIEFGTLASGEDKQVESTFGYRPVASDRHRVFYTCSYFVNGRIVFIDGEA